MVLFLWDIINSTDIGLRIVGERVGEKEVMDWFITFIMVEFADLQAPLETLYMRKV